MYSSLGKIDIAVDSDEGPVYVQTDHREPAEIEAEPEVSVLFALTRVLLAHAHGAKSDSGKAKVIYTCIHDAPAFLVEALAAARASLEVQGGQVKRELAPVAVTPAELADRAFTALARRAQNRVGLTDPAAALRALEAEAMAEGPTVEEEEGHYWTYVLELAAVTGEIVRARHGGRWIECDRAEIPFGFDTPGTGTLLPTNRASRFLDDGEGESMFLLLASLAETKQDRADAPILPSLRARADVIREKMIWRPLIDKADDDVPVIAYGTDTPTSFGLLMDTRADDRDELHAKAMANIKLQAVEVEDVDLGGIRVLAVTGSFFATEKLLDAAFMTSLHARLRAQMLAVTVPRRGLMFVTDAAPADIKRGMAVLTTITDKEAGTSRRISTAILLVADGALVGRVQLTLGEPDPEEPDEAPKKKPGLFRRLFGRSE